MNSDLCDVCGRGGAGGFRGDGLSAQQHPGVNVTISVNLKKQKRLHFETAFYICAPDNVNLLTTKDLLSSYQTLFNTYLQ